MLRAESVTRSSSSHNAVKALYHEAFPEVERIPFWFLVFRARRKVNDFRAYFDEDTFVGFTYAVETSKLVFILYFAVNTAIQSKGYGTRILQALEQQYLDKCIALEIESVDESAPNLEQRRKRQVFYERNGYVGTGIQLHEKGVTYDVLSKHGNCSKEELEEAMKLFSGFIFSLFNKPRFT